MSVDLAVDLFYSKEDPMMAGRSAEDRNISEIGLGFSRVSAVSHYVERGAPHALSAERKFSLNFDLEFDAEGLRGFLYDCFPDIMAEERGRALLAHIEPGRRYQVSTFDMS